MLLRRNRVLLGTLLLVLLCASLIFSAKADSTMWSQTYGGTDIDSDPSVLETSDGGYALAGRTESFGAGEDDIWLVKTDASGNMEWNRTYGGADGDWSSSLILTSDDGYAIAGVTGSFGVGDHDIWLIKLDSSGNMQWNKTYGGKDNDYVGAVVEAPDGGYAIAGTWNWTTYYEEGNSVPVLHGDFWLIKTDIYGNMQWNKTYTGIYDDYAFSLVATSDGGYAIAGQTLTIGDGGYDFWLVKTDAVGNMQWNRTYGGISVDYVYSLVETSDGGYALAGVTNSFGAGGLDSWLVKTDEVGNKEWNHTYGGSGNDMAFSLIQVSDGGYAIAGRNDSTGGVWCDFWLVKTDAFGNMEWDQTYGGTSEDVATSVIETSDGGYALAGKTMSFGAGWSDFWLVKTDEFGVVPEAPWIILPLLAIATVLIFVNKKKLISRW